MILQRQPNRWSCVATAFAMALDVPLTEVLQLVGHDGSQIVFPTGVDPSQRRGFHPQEMLLIAEHYEKSFVMYEPRPVTSYSQYEFEIDMPPGRLDRILIGSHGVLCGLNRLGNRHAVAWNGFEIYDPSGDIYSVEQFNIVTYFRIQSF